MVCITLEHELAPRAGNASRCGGDALGLAHGGSKIVVAHGVVFSNLWFGVGVFVELEVADPHKGNVPEHANEKAAESKEIAPKRKDRSDKRRHWVDASSELAWEHENTANGRKNAGRNQHALEEKVQIPRSINEQNVAEIWNPNDADNVQKDSPQHVKSVLNVAQDRPSFVGEEEVNL